MGDNFTLGSFGTNVSVKLQAAKTDNTRVNTTQANAIKQYGTGLAGILPKPQADQAANVALSRDIQTNIAAREITTTAESRGVALPKQAVMEKLTALSAQHATNSPGSLSNKGPSGPKAAVAKARNFVSGTPTATTLSQGGEVAQLKKAS